MKKLSLIVFSVLFFVFAFAAIVSVSAKEGDDKKMSQAAKQVEKAIKKLEKIGDRIDFSEQEFNAGKVPETLNVGPKGRARITAGKVTATASSTFTAMVWKMNFTVHKMPETKVVARGGGHTAFENIKVGDVVDAEGALDSDTPMFIHAGVVHNRSALSDTRQSEASRLQAVVSELMEKLNKLLKDRSTSPSPTPPPPPTPSPTPSSSDTSAPTVPGGFVAQTVSSSQINLSWGVSTDNVGVVSYKIYRCAGAACETGELIATVTTTTYQNTGLSAATMYAYNIQAFDAAGNGSAKARTNAETQSASIADTSAPTAPASVSAGVVSASTTQINLSWLAAVDNVAVTGYRIYRCTGMSCTPSDQIATAIDTSYTDSGRATSTTYVYSVAAHDAAGNVSPKSNTGYATTP